MVGYHLRAINKYLINFWNEMSTATEFERQKQQQAILAELSQRAVSNWSLSMLMKEMATLAAQGVEVAYTLILILRDDQDALVWGAGSGWPEAITGQLKLEVDLETLVQSEHIIIESLEQSSQHSWSAMLKNQGIVSGVSIVVRGRNRPFGILGVYTTSQRIFTETETYFLQTMVNILAAALERERAMANIAQLQRELFTFRLAGAALTSSLDLQEVLYTVARGMTQLLTVPGCALFEWRESDDSLHLLVDFGPDNWSQQRPSGWAFTLADSPATKQVLVERAPRQMTINQPDLDPAELAYIQQAAIETLLILPMIFQDQAIGLIYLMDDWPGRIFTNDEIMMAQLQANQAAGAIENARLYGETQQRLAEQVALRRAGAIFSSTLELDVVLGHIAEQLCLAISVTSAYISSYNPEAGTATLLAEYLSARAAPAERQDSDIGVTFDLEQGFPGTIELLRVGRPRSFFADSPELSKLMQAYLGQYGVQSWLILPLYIEEQVVAFAELWENRQRREFKPEEISLCQGIGQQAAIAIQNARLYQQAQQEIAERKQVEAELQQYKAHLEEEVAARTQELTRTNAELQAKIIEREQVEAALIQARDEALTANRLKTELLANVSHELRTPLSVIMGFVELLEMGSYGPITEIQGATLAKILVQSQRQLGLINDLLDQARLEVGELNLRVNHFRPSDLLEDIRTRLVELAQAKGLTLIIDVAADMPVFLSGDLARLQQILVNLVDNAIKFTEQGQVTVRLYRPSDEQWVMEVSDTGPGIPVEVQSRIFEPFGQRDSSVTRSHGGLGLGLSIAKQLVMLMEGEFSLASQVGQGSVFRVTLPVSPASHEDVG